MATRKDGVAIRGKVWQAVLLGLSAAFSHSVIVWVLATIALKYGSRWNAETTEPYFQLASAVIIASLAIWMFWRTRRDTKAAAAHEHHGHDQAKQIDTSHGIVRISVAEADMPPVFRLAFSEHGRAFVPEPSSVIVETVRSGDVRQIFAFVEKMGVLESTSDIPEPHDFDLTITLSHGGHAYTYPAQFREHDHDHGDLPAGEEFQDAHEAAHALDIQKRFKDRQITTPQIVLFGLTGGLVPCPASFTVLIVCMQVKRFTLGFALVAAFSFGLAITMVTVGAVAAWSVGHAEKKFSGFGNLMRKAPYISCALLVTLASYMAYQGWHGLLVKH